MSAIEQYIAPTSLEEAVRAAADGNATLLAGGTDLMPQSRSGLRSLGERLLNLRRVPDLCGVTRQGATLRIGALTTVTEILDDELLAREADILPRAADRFASGQVRNSATLGGNVCNASPAGDLIIPLLLLDAEAELASWQDGAVTRRLLPLHEFFTGPGATRRQPGEILTAFQFAAPGSGFVAVFDKFGTRPALDIAIVSVGIAGRLESTRAGGERAVGQADDPPRLRDVRVACGAVAPIPLRAVHTEEILEGETLTRETIARAATTAADEITPISDVRASAWYRLQITRVLTERLLVDVSQTGN